MIRPIAIYLPQFHPIPENDYWWGKGFTEWRNVASAKPFKKYHYQPHIPSDLGFYDLRLNDVFYEQIKLAKESGIHGFMFYEYWFGGKRLLETPIDNYLTDEKITFPYFLCWANENWTRRWDGRDTEVLIEQVYSTEDFEKHFDAVYARHITSEKYIKVDGKPVISIYKPNMIQNLELLIDVWRSKARALGFSDLYFIYCNQSGIVPDSILRGFDAAYEFHPNWKICSERKHRFFFDFINRISYARLRKWLSFIQKFRKSDSNKYYDYKSYSEDTRHNPRKIAKIYPGIMTSWDNSPRRKNGNAVVFLNSTPEIYKSWFSRIINDFKPFSQDENFIFINAWNEWAEGAHLEPCLKWGNLYLKATKEALEA